MSSLAATQADGYYLPPEYFEGGAYKKQSKNAFHHNATTTKSSSKNNKKVVVGHNQYLQRGVVRFELPYKGICEGCQESIGRGTRYNATKSQAGNYFTTPIHQFDMKCRNCQHPWIIRTNPQERGFDYVKGIQIQAGQDINLAKGDGVLSSGRATGSSVGGNVYEDNSNNVLLQQLESAAHGKRKTLTEIEELQRLQTLNSKSMFMDAANNALVRRVFRKDRKDKRQRQSDATKKGWRQGMELRSKDNAGDVLTSKEATYGQPREEERKRLRHVRASSIFSAANKSEKRRKRPRQLPSHDTAVSSPPSPVRSIDHTLIIPKVSTVATNQVAANSSQLMSKPKRSIQLSFGGAGKVVSKGLTASKEALICHSSSLSAMLASYDSSSSGTDD